MTKLVLRFDADLSWKSWSAITIFGCGFLGLMMGVGVSERPGIPEADLLTKAYYTLGLFVLGGLDLGTPVHGPLLGRTLLWVAYFGAPIWTASAVFQTILNALRPPVWHVRNIKRKIIIFGGGELALGFLNRITRSDNAHGIIVIVDEAQHPYLDELNSYKGVKVFVTSGDQMHRLNARTAVTPIRGILTILKSGSDSSVRWLLVMRSRFLSSPLEMTRPIFDAPFGSESNLTTP